MSEKVNGTKNELLKLIEESICFQCQGLTFLQLEKMIDQLLASKSHLNDESVQDLLNSKNQIDILRNELNSSEIPIDGSVDLIKILVTDLSEAYAYIDSAANKLLNKIEDVSKLTKGNKQAETILSEMIVDCDFHDLVGQRIIRVIKNLQKFENSTLKLLKVLSITPRKSSLTLMEDGASYGPAMNDSGVEQDLIDEFLKEGNK
jgi:hypothetical protein